MKTEENKTSDMKKFIIHKWNSAGISDRYEKTESELTKEEKDLLLGELIYRWENNTEENKTRFMEMIYQGLKERNNELLSKRIEAEMLGGNCIHPPQAILVDDTTNRMYCGMCGIEHA